MLRIVSKILTVLAWGVALFSTAVQLLTMLAFGQLWEQDGRPLMFVLVLVATLTLWAGFVLRRVRRDKPVLGLFVITLSGVLFIVAAVAVQLYTMPGNIPHINQATGEVAMDWGKLLSRHYLPVLVPVLLWLGFWAKNTYTEKQETQEIMQAIRDKNAGEPETIDLETAKTDKK